jgi:hypothetical protein
MGAASLRGAAVPVKLRNPKARAHRARRPPLKAYIARDYVALHRALDLRPWQPSPLPLSATPLGVDASACRTWPGDLGGTDWRLAGELQAELEAAIQGKAKS